MVEGLQIIIHLFDNCLHLEAAWACYLDATTRLAAVEVHVGCDSTPQVSLFFCDVYIFAPCQSWTCIHEQSTFVAVLHIYHLQLQVAALSVSSCIHCASAETSQLVTISCLQVAGEL